MLNILFYVILVFCSAITIIQDFKTRTIHLFVLIGFFLTGLIHIWPFGFDGFLIILFNFSYLSVLLLIAFLVLNIWKSLSAKEMIGMGDILYLIIMTLFFDFPEFIIALNFALIGSMILHLLLCQLFHSYKIKRYLPMAGLMVPFFTISIVFDTWLGHVIQLFN